MRMKNKTYVIDWGKETNGGRYALIQAPSMEDALMDVDHAIGCVPSIALLKIPDTGEGIKYMEIDENPYAGPSLSELSWSVR